MSDEPNTRRHDYGSAVRDGVVNYLSPSAITKADPRAFGGCLRRWFYRYVLKRPEPKSKSQALGVKCHGEIEHYERTGEMVLGSITRPALRYIPKGPVPATMLVEHDIAHGSLAAAPLRIINIPVIGYIDLSNYTGIYVGEDGEPHQDPPGTIEQLDYKTTKDEAYIIPGKQLAHTVQMVAYGEYGAISSSGVAHLRLSHVNMHSVGKPWAKKSTVLVSRDAIGRAWESIEPVARSIRDAAKETAADKVDANLAACGDYGGCPHRPYCRAANHDSLAKLLGKDPSMGLVDKLNLAGVGTTAPAAPTSLVGSLISPPAGVGVSLDVQAQMAALAAAEVKPPAPPPIDPNIAVFAAEWAKIEAMGFGKPRVAAPVNALRAAMLAHPAPGPTPYMGDGEIANVEITTLEQAAQLVAELGSLRAARTAAAQLAARSSDVVPHVGAVTPPAAVQPPTLGPSIAPPDVPASRPEAASAQPEAKGVAISPNVTGEVKRGRGRPKGSGNKPKAPAATLAQGIAEIPTEAAESLELFVDAIPNVPYESLRPYVDALAASLAKEHNAAEIRCAPADGPLGFGKWRGALAAFVREAPPPLGTYYLDTRGNEVNEVVAAALEPTCDLFVRGIR